MVSPLPIVVELVVALVGASYVSFRNTHTLYIVYFRADVAHLNHPLRTALKESVSWNEDGEEVVVPQFLPHGDNPDQLHSQEGRRYTVGRCVHSYL